MQSNSSNRRKFLTQSVSLIGAGLIVSTMPALINSCSSSTSPNGNNNPSPMDINIASYPELQNVNGFKKITFSGKNFDLPIIVIRKSTTEFTVLSSHCPHQGCEVDNPVISSNSISCHCHGSKYNLDGGLINGPSNSPLTRFTNTYNSSTNILTVQIY